MTHNHIPDQAERLLPDFNMMQRVKRRFFAMRNGAVADKMARLGAAYRINFGLNLPQIGEIARDFMPGGAEYEAVDMAAFARRLRDNSSTRESMLIAPMLFPVDGLTEDEAVEWGKTVQTAEVADVLCMKLLRNHPQGLEIARQLIAREDIPLAAYCGLRLLLNLLQTGKMAADEAEYLIDGMEMTPLTMGVLRQIRDEMEWLKEDA